MGAFAVRWFGLTELPTPAEDGPRERPPIVPNSAWKATKRGRCRFPHRWHRDIVPDPALPHRLMCVRCGKTTYRVRSG